MEMTKVRKQTEACLAALLEQAGLEAGEILVIGCSTSEVLGQKIGTASSEAAAEAIFSAVYPVLTEKGLWLAAQCCEHLNRAIVMEKAAARQFCLTPVTVIPMPKAGGSWSTWVYRHLREPVVVETLDRHLAAAGMDIGETCIGMHLRPVGVMVRPAQPWIGEARVTMVRTRPKLIGGERARYN